MTHEHDHDEDQVEKETVKDLDPKEAGEDVKGGDVPPTIGCTPEIKKTKPTT